MKIALRTACIVLLIGMTLAAPAAASGAVTIISFFPYLHIAGL